MPALSPFHPARNDASDHGRAATTPHPNPLPIPCGEGTILVLSPSPCAQGEAPLRPFRLFCPSRPSLPLPMATHPLLRQCLGLMLAIASHALPATTPPPIDLAGEWRFALDPSDAGAGAKPADWRFPDTIRLPGMVTAQGFGEDPSIETKWTGDGWRYRWLYPDYQKPGSFKFPFFLQPPKHYVGPAWFQREVAIPADWNGCRIVLHLERVHWQSWAWLDGKPMPGCRLAPKNDSLGTPHEFDLGPAMPGRHVITLRIDNRLSPVNVGPLSHSVTDHTQGNWNGAVGTIKLRPVPALGLDTVRVVPDNDGSVKIMAQVHNHTLSPVAATLVATLHEKAGGKEVGRAQASVSCPAAPSREHGSTPATATLDPIVVRLATPPALWSEFNPALYEARVRLEGNGMSDERRMAFGFREIRNQNGRLTLNGRRLFLRGTLECCIFPLTGHPPMDKPSWNRIFRIAKSFGLNHMRFHSWCPPEPAFQAADEIGFYLAPEVSSWANQGAEIGSGRPLDQWIEDETLRMADAYRHHPSFVMLAYGNEPAGPNHTKWLQEWVTRWKEREPGRLYTTGSGWPVAGGSDYHSSPQPRIQAWGEGLKSVINSQPPRTDFDYAGFVRQHPDAPVVSHEIGQWCVYPNFDEIAKYTGYFKARNFEIFRAEAEKNGLLPQARDFLLASGRLQTLCYKHDIEAALRTPGFGGFQLLDLHDFPGQGSALVGVLDAFWDEKGYVTAKEFRRFCGPVVPLARMPKLVLQEGETLAAAIELAQFGPDDLPATAVGWTVRDRSGQVIATGKLPAKPLPAGDVISLGNVTLPVGNLPAGAAEWILEVTVPGTDASNQWSLFVFPKPAPEAVPPGVLVTATLDAAAKAHLAKGGRVVWLPPPGTAKGDPRLGPVKMGFSSIFWNTAWTNWQPPHTLGILCDPKHAALAGFPTDAHANWQWWEPMTGSCPFILTAFRDLKPVVQVIDDWFTNRKLGLVFEAKVGGGGLLACAADLASNLDRRPSARQLRASLLRYVGSPAFTPTVTIDTAAVEALVEAGPATGTSGR